MGREWINCNINANHAGVWWGWVYLINTRAFCMRWNGTVNMFIWGSIVVVKSVPRYGGGQFDERDVNEFTGRSFI